ncbi:MAG: diguanylate cyclase [Thermodesulfobacteriota bacterium]|nr:diguanylate cyclase [Thermodesulfobacteriota bacterium]
MHTLLIVDDSPDNISFLMEILKDEYKLTAATSGEQALAMLASMRKLPDLILLDILMPGMDGYKVCKTLKNSDRTCNIPVIFITASTEVADEAMGFSLGAVDFISKPYHPLIIKARIKTHINLKIKTDMLEQLASLDGLTNIANRRKFDETLKNEWQRAVRHHFSLSLIMIDVDQFKKYNDNYGHAAGDICLQKIAAVLQECVKRPYYDLVARYGGEEFVVILPDVGINGGTQIALSIKNRVEALKIPLEYSTTNKYLTISLGLATIRPHKGIQSGMELVEAADKLMYQAKQAGGNQLMTKDLSKTNGHAMCFSAQAATQ